LISEKALSFPAFGKATLLSGLERAKKTFSQHQ
jgi:hypothetical protein